MNLIDYFRKNRKKSAATAKERLQILLAHERAGGSALQDYLPALKQDILEVVARYVDIAPQDVRMHLEREGDCEILELNITLPESPHPKVAAR